MPRSEKLNFLAGLDETGTATEEVEFVLSQKSVDINSKEFTLDNNNTILSTLDEKTNKDEETISDSAVLEKSQLKTHQSNMVAEVAENEKPTTATSLKA